MEKRYLKRSGPVSLLRPGYPCTFWLQLQANYDAEVLQYGEGNSVSEDECGLLNELKDFLIYTGEENNVPSKTDKNENVLFLRKYLRISSLTNLQKLPNQGAYRMQKTNTINPSVLGAWLCLCRKVKNTGNVTERFDPSSIVQLTEEIKTLMCISSEDPRHQLKDLLTRYGIDFSVLKHFHGAPVQGYLREEDDGIYQIVLTSGKKYADVFWFSLFHELGHIINGDLSGKNRQYIDVLNEENDTMKSKADHFANNALIDPNDYNRFIERYDFSYSSISDFALSRKVPPYIVSEDFRSISLFPGHHSISIS